VHVTGAPGGSLSPPPDHVDENDYRNQLRKMQRSMSPGSVQQLQPMAPEPRVSISETSATLPSDSVIYSYFTYLLVAVKLTL